MTKNLSIFKIPLTGLQVIEASAGTGKTWTIAGLYLRIVLGLGVKSPLLPNQILVMTFTELATAELRSRIRKRLYEAAKFFEQKNHSSTEEDEFLKELKAYFPEKEWDECAKKLNLCAQWMDEAAIFTIHGWSARVLKEHAFESVSLFNQALMEDQFQLKLSAAQQYWRQYIYPLNSHEFSILSSYKPFSSDPNQLIESLEKHFLRHENNPDHILVSSTPPKEFTNSVIRWEVEITNLRQEAIKVWGPEFCASLKEMILSKREDGTIQSEEYKSINITNGIKKIIKCLDKEEDLVILKRFSTTELIKNGWTGAKELAELQYVDKLLDLIENKPDIESLMNHATQSIIFNQNKTKELNAQFSFLDLLQNLYKALYKEGSKLANVIQRQYPIALVDEFQDTDPWQYASLKKIYIENSSEDSGLIIIGDPKQAIYSFRGADLATYLKAREQAGSNLHSLPNNYRSTKNLIDAVNHIFLKAHKPFQQIEYKAVTAAAKEVPLVIRDQEQAAMTVWHTPADKILSSGAYKNLMAELFASEITNLLNSKAVQPSDVAILVRSFKEANLVRDFLFNYGVRSVYLSDGDSVYASEEAQELRLLMLSIANPKSIQLVKAAVSTRIWGLSYEQIEELILSDSQLNDVIEKFHRYLIEWQKFGFLPMLYRMIHENSIAIKLLSKNGHSFINGERVLTNLLHLGDLLQTESLNLKGELPLIRYLERQLNNPGVTSASSIVRLESEENLVKILTIHKSKGLEFQLVFIPFASGFNSKIKTGTPEDISRLEEDIRLLYVGITRAKKSLWLGLSNIKSDLTNNSSSPRSAVSALLGRKNKSDFETCLQEWGKCVNISIKPAQISKKEHYYVETDKQEFKPAASATRAFTANWWIASFSNLVKGFSREKNISFDESVEFDKLSDSQLDNPLTDLLSSNNERLVQNRDKNTEDLPYSQIASTSSFGNFLHELLEWQFNKGWPINMALHNPEIEKEWDLFFENKSIKFNFSKSDQSIVFDWIQKIVNKNFRITDTDFLLKTFCLSSFSNDIAWAEMEFSLHVNFMGVGFLDQLITSYVSPQHERPVLRPNQMNGMLVGVIDLVFEQDGRYYIIDYKSNYLKDYSLESLQISILSHRYDVQLTLYVLALHRLLKSRLHNYDYTKHMGGAIYLFLRGIDAPSGGVFTHLPSKDLIEQLDLAFKNGDLRS